MDISDLFFGSVTVGERGQIVIPAEARAALEIKPGDKLIVMRDPVHKCFTIGKLERMRQIIDEYEAAYMKIAESHAQGQPEEGAE